MFVALGSLLSLCDLFARFDIVVLATVRILSFLRACVVINVYQVYHKCRSFREKYSRAVGQFARSPAHLSPDRFTPPPFSVGCSSPFITLHATFCLVGESPTCSVPAL
ncbi:unnamed protein product [Laminaria digitata]